MTSGCKNQWGLGQEKKLLDYQESSFKSPHGLGMYANLLTLGFSTSTTAGRAQVAYREKVKRLEAQWVLGDSFLLGKHLEARQQQCPPSSPPPTQSHKAVNWVAPPWRLPKALPHTIYRCLYYNRPQNKTGSQSCST